MQKLIQWFSNLIGVFDVTAIAVATGIVVVLAIILVVALAVLLVVAIFGWIASTITDSIDRSYRNQAKIEGMKNDVIDRMQKKSRGTREERANS